MGNKRNNIKINYLSRDYSSIKEDLIAFARRYYPDTFQDFSTAGFGALMLDTVAYVGDILSFYLDYQANESFLSTAIEYENILKHGQTVGYKHQGARASYGNITLYAIIPANASATGPDTDYMPIIKAGSTFAAANNILFTLLEDVNLADSANEIVTANTTTTGEPENFAVKATGVVVSGEDRVKKFTVGDFVKFRTLSLPGNNITEVLSIADLEGYQYYEVDHLSQNTIYVPISNNDTTTNVQAPNILKPVIVPRRYIVQNDRNQTVITFGYGSEAEISFQSLDSSRDVVLNIHSKNYITDTALDPSVLIKTDQFGVGPSNTTVYVTYRTNTARNSNATSNSVTTPVNIQSEFANRTQLLGSKMAGVRSSIECTNEEPIQGDVRAPGIDDLKYLIQSSYSSQNRAVTAEDYKGMVLMMPSKFGGVERCSIIQDVDSNLRNINIYTISRSPLGFYEPTNSIVKENIKTWLSSKRMINDSVDILDAKIVNLGIKFELISEMGVNKTQIFSDAVSRLTAFLVNGQDVGEDFSITDLYTVLNNVPGVIDTVSIKVDQIANVGYSSTIFNVKTNTSPDGRYIKAPVNVVFEIKYPSADIQGTIV